MGWMQQGGKTILKQEFPLRSILETAGADQVLVTSAGFTDLKKNKQKTKLFAKVLHIWRGSWLGVARRDCCKHLLLPGQLQHHEQRQRRAGALCSFPLLQSPQPTSEGVPGPVGCCCPPPGPAAVLLVLPASLHRSKSQAAFVTAILYKKKKERGVCSLAQCCVSGGKGRGGLWRAAFPQYIALKSPWGGISDANGASLLPLYTVCSGTCCKTAPVLPLLRFKEQKEKGSVLWQCREGGS